MTSSLPVAFYLKELSGEPARRGGRQMALGGESASDVEMQIGEAHARGILEARAEAQVELDVAITKQAAEFDKKLATERQRWAAEQGERLAELIASELEQIEQRVSDCVSRILQPLLAEQIRGRAVDELARSLGAMLSKGEFAKITISGPQDLLSAMEARLDGSQAGLSFEVADGVELSVSADDTILETRIGSWGETIKGNAK
jgi:hypothetical protein